MEHWYCVHTKPAREDTVCKLLLPFPAIETYCPDIKRKKRVGGTWRDVIEKLFPGYLFARFDLPRYMHTVRNTRGVRRIVGDHCESPWVVDPEIIDAIKARGFDECFEEKSASYRHGEGVQIVDGLLMGLQGVFLYELNASERVVILLNILESQTRVQIDKHMLTSCPRA